MAVECGGSKFLLGFSDQIASPMRKVSVASRGFALVLPRFEAEIAKAKQRFKLADDAPVFSVYEAGYEGFWLHRALVSIGVHNVVIDPSSLRVEQKARRVKTDRLDLQKLLEDLFRYHRGEKVWRTLTVPTLEEEDERRLTRRRDALCKEKTMHVNRIKGLLNGNGIKVKNSDLTEEGLAELKRFDESYLGVELASELRDEVARLNLVKSQLAGIKARLVTLLKQARPQSKAVEVAQRLEALRGIGPISSFTLALEFFWRSYDNRKQVGAYAGLVDSHWKSDQIDRQQGVSKAGNRRIRTVMVELAWNWVLWQPESDISRWFQANSGKGKKRLRKVAIVAVARKLLVALWRYVEHGVVPGGAIFSRESPETEAA
ncbi:MAG: IS110 family transposase [Planctomycetota bacterium]